MLYKYYNERPDHFDFLPANEWIKYSLEYGFSKLRFLLLGNKFYERVNTLTWSFFVPENEGSGL